MSEYIVNTVLEIDWKIVFSGAALIISLLAWREARKYREAEKQMKDRQLASEISADLARAWDLMGGDLDTESVSKFPARHRMNEAKRLIMNCLLRNDNYAPCYRHMGIYYYGVGNFDKAEKEFKRALQIDAHSAYCYNNLGKTLRALGRYDEAEDTYRRAIDVDPDYAIAHHNLGSLYIHLNRYIEAIESLRKALEVDPNFPKSYEKLAISLENLGRNEEAKEAFLEAQQLEAHSFIST